VGKRTCVLRVTGPGELRLLAGPGSEPGVEREPRHEPGEPGEQLPGRRLPRSRFGGHALLGPADRLHVRVVRQALRDAGGDDGRPDDDAPVSADDDRPRTRLRGYVCVRLPDDHAGRAADLDAGRELSAREPRGHRAALAEVLMESWELTARELVRATVMRYV